MVKIGDVQDAIRKQNAEKIIRESWEEGYKCPNCNEDRYWKDGVHCKDCGQKIDWGE